MIFRKNPQLEEKIDPPKSVIKALPIMDNSFYLGMRGMWKGKFILVDDYEDGFIGHADSLIQNIPNYIGGAGWQRKSVPIDPDNLQAYIKDGRLVRAMGSGKVASLIQIKDNEVEKRFSDYIRQRSWPLIPASLDFLEVGTVFQLFNDRYVVTEAIKSGDINVHIEAVRFDNAESPKLTFEYSDDYGKRVLLTKEDFIAILKNKFGIDVTRSIEEMPQGEEDVRKIRDLARRDMVEKAIAGTQIFGSKKGRGFEETALNVQTVGFAKDEELKVLQDKVNEISRATVMQPILTVMNATLLTLFLNDPENANFYKIMIFGVLMNIVGMLTLLYNKKQLSKAREPIDAEENIIIDSLHGVISKYREFAQTYKEHQQFDDADLTIAKGEVSKSIREMEENIDFIKIKLARELAEASSIKESSKETSEFEEVKKDRRNELEIENLRNESLLGLLKPATNKEPARVRLSENKPSNDIAPEDGEEREQIAEEDRVSSGRKV